MGKMKVQENYDTPATMLITLLTQANNVEITDACENKTEDELEKAVFDHFAKTVKFNSERRY
jgi:hypothetical protein